jgi:transposase
MKTVDDYEAIRRAFYLEGKGIREISRELHHGRAVIRKAIAQAEPEKYTLTQPREAPVLDPFKARIQKLLDESKDMPRKQRYTAHTIYKLLVKEGYRGSEGSVHHYVSQERQKRKQVQAYLPLEYDPGQDAQVDWIEVVVELAGQRVVVQVFILRLNYSKVRFVRAFPFQKQEAFFEGHVQGFHFLGGIPRRITYDNLKTAVFRVLEGHTRVEQAAFKAFRSYYLFESHYCTPAQGHEKGGVENDGGYAERNFFSPLRKAADFEDLNTQLLQACGEDMQRHVRGQEGTAETLWRAEKGLLLPLGEVDYPCCSHHMVKVNPYSQVVFETNRYSVPTRYTGKQLVLRAFPFRIQILSLNELVATHKRSFGREQDILEPLHYLGLLEQRPGAFEHALPLRQWRKTWAGEYEQLLERLRSAQPGGAGVREFVAVLKLHQQYPTTLVDRAVRQALELGAAHLDGVQLCLRQLQEDPKPPIPLPSLACPEWASVGTQPVNLEQYNQLLGRH